MLIKKKRVLWNEDKQDKINLFLPSRHDQMKIDMVTNKLKSSFIIIIIHWSNNLGAIQKVCHSPKDQKGRD